MTDTSSPDTTTVTVATDTAMRALGRAIAAETRAGDLLLLSGPLGAGKTTFARHLLRSLGATGRIKSPTYALLEPYELPGLKASHLDFYRFDDPREWLDAGLREVFEQPGLKLAEWPDKAGTLLPVPDLRLQITPHDDGHRDVTVHANTPRGVELLA